MKGVPGIKQFEFTISEEEEGKLLRISPAEVTIGQQYDHLAQRLMFYRPIGREAHTLVLVFQPANSKVLYEKVIDQGNAFEVPGYLTNGTILWMQAYFLWDSGRTALSSKVKLHLGASLPKPGGMTPENEGLLHDLVERAWMGLEEQEKHIDVLAMGGQKVAELPKAGASQELFDRVEGLEQHSTDTDTKLSTAESSLADLKEQADTSTGKVAALEKQATEANRKIGVLDGLAEDADERLIALDTSLKEVISKIPGLEGDSSSVGEKVAALESFASDTTEKITSLVNQARDYGETLLQLGTDKANNSDVVKLTADQTITGKHIHDGKLEYTKNADTDTSVVNKRYLDQRLADIDVEVDLTDYAQTTYVDTQIEEVRTFVDSGKTALAAAIVEKGGTVAPGEGTPTFEALTAAVRGIPAGGGLKNLLKITNPDFSELEYSGVNATFNTNTSILHITGTAYDQGYAVLYENASGTKIQLQQGKSYLLCSADPRWMRFRLSCMLKSSTNDYVFPEPGEVFSADKVYDLDRLDLQVMMDGEFSVANGQDFYIGLLEL